MKKLTKKERGEHYWDALAYLEEVDRACLCFALRRNDKIYQHYLSEIESCSNASLTETITDVFPELKLFSPTKKITIENWLGYDEDDKNVRRTILGFCIAMSNQINNHE